MTDPAGGCVGPAASELPPQPTPAAAELFGSALVLAQQYAGLLASTGIAHGHLGPREIPRLWDRHLGNCAVVTDLVPHAASVVDVGSGAGLPGLAMAIRRADLAVTLLEPMQRRCTFLEQAVQSLGLASRVRVVRGRAEEPSVVRSIGNVQWATARAVAPLDRLLQWCLPLLAPGGCLLALKGSTAADEVTWLQNAATRRLRLAVRSIDVVELGHDYRLEPTYVIRVERSTSRWRSE